MKNLLTQQSPLKLLVAISCLLLIFACKKDDSDLPKPTQSGADTFGCKVNGKSWVPDGSPGPLSLPPVSCGYSPNYLVITSAYKKGGSSNESIQIYLNNVTKPGTYSLNYDTGYYPQAFNAENHATYSTRYPDTFYGTTSQVGGSVTITRADTVAKIVSGTFSLNAVDKDCNQVKITSGRFDVSNQ